MSRPGSSDARSRDMSTEHKRGRTSGVLTDVEMRRRARERSRIAARRLAEEREEADRKRKVPVDRRVSARSTSREREDPNPTRGRCKESQENRRSARSSSLIGRRRSMSGRSSSPGIAAVVNPRGRGRGRGRGRELPTRVPQPPGTGAGVASGVATTRTRTSSTLGIVASQAAAGIVPTKPPTGERTVLSREPPQLDVEEGGGENQEEKGAGRRRADILATEVAPRRRAQSLAPTSGQTGHARTVARRSRLSDPPPPLLHSRMAAGPRNAGGAGRGGREPRGFPATDSEAVGTAPNPSRLRTTTTSSIATRARPSNVEAKISSVERLKAGGDGHSQATQDGHRQREPSLSSGQEGREGEDSKPAGQATRKNHSTLAYMSRQRRQALAKKKNDEMEKAKKAENLKLALQKLDEERRRRMSLPRLRSRSRGRTGAAARASTGSRGRPPVASTRNLAFATAGTSSGRPAWVNVADDTPEASSPPDVQVFGPPMHGLPRVGQEGQSIGRNGNTSRRVSLKRVPSTQSRGHAPATLEGTMRPSTSIGRVKEEKSIISRDDTDKGSCMKAAPTGPDTCHGNGGNNLSNCEAEKQAEHQPSQEAMHEENDGVESQSIEEPRADTPVETWAEEKTNTVASLDERLPEMIETLERVSATVHDLRGRCDRLSRVMDAQDIDIRENMYGFSPRDIPVAPPSMTTVPLPVPVPRPLRQPFLNPPSPDELLDTDEESAGFRPERLRWESTVRRRPANEDPSGDLIGGSTGRNGGGSQPSEYNESQVPTNVYPWQPPPSMRPSVLSADIRAAMATGPVEEPVEESSLRPALPISEIVAEGIIRNRLAEHHEELEESRQLPVPQCDDRQIQTDTEAILDSRVTPSVIMSDDIDALASVRGTQVVPTAAESGTRDGEISGIERISTASPPTVSGGSHEVAEEPCQHQGHGHEDGMEQGIEVKYEKETDQRGPDEEDVDEVKEVAVASPQAELEVNHERRRLAPAELQAQLLNELRLHEELQEATLEAERLISSMAVEQALQGARRVEHLLRLRKETQARNQAREDAAVAQEEVERRSEAVTSAVVEAIVTSADAQGRQAIAAVAAIAAVSGHSQDRQAAIVATAAGEAIASKTKGREAPSSSNEFESGGISSDAYIGDDAADAKHQGGNERVEHGRIHEIDVKQSREANADRSDVPTDARTETIEGYAHVPRLSQDSLQRSSSSDEARNDHYMFSSARLSCTADGTPAVPDARDSRTSEDIGNPLNIEEQQQGERQGQGSLRGIEYVDVRMVVDEDDEAQEVPLDYSVNENDPVHLAGSEAQKSRSEHMPAAGVELPCLDGGADTGDDGERISSAAQYTEHVQQEPEEERDGLNDVSGLVVGDDESDSAAAEVVTSSDGEVAKGNISYDLEAEVQSMAIEVRANSDRPGGASSEDDGVVEEDVSYDLEAEAHNMPAEVSTSGGEGDGDEVAEEDISYDLEAEVRTSGAEGDDDGVAEEDVSYDLEAEAHIISTDIIRSERLGNADGDVNEVAEDDISYDLDAESLTMAAEFRTSGAEVVGDQVAEEDMSVDLETELYGVSTELIASGDLPSCVDSQNGVESKSAKYSDSVVDEHATDLEDSDPQEYGSASFENISPAVGHGSHDSHASGEEQRQDELHIEARLTCGRLVPMDHDVSDSTERLLHGDMNTTARLPSGMREDQEVVCGCLPRAKDDVEMAVPMASPRAVAPGRSETREGGDIRYHGGTLAPDVEVDRSHLDKMVVAPLPSAHPSKDLLEGYKDVVAAELPAPSEWFMLRRPLGPELSPNYFSAPHAHGAAYCRADGAERKPDGDDDLDGDSFDSEKLAVIHTSREMHPKIKARIHALMDGPAARKARELKAALVIQALFRGYRVRRSPSTVAGRESESGMVNQIESRSAWENSVDMRMTRGNDKENSSTYPGRDAAEDMRRLTGNMAHEELSDSFASSDALVPDGWAGEDETKCIPEEMDMEGHVRRANSSGAKSGAEEDQATAKMTAIWWRQERKLARGKCPEASKVRMFLELNPSRANSKNDDEIYSPRPHSASEVASLPDLCAVMDLLGEPYVDAIPLATSREPLVVDDANDHLKVVSNAQEEKPTEFTEGSDAVKAAPDAVASNRNIAKNLGCRAFEAEHTEVSEHAEDVEGQKHEAGEEKCLEGDEGVLSSRCSRDVYGRSEFSDMKEAVAAAASGGEDHAEEGDLRVTPVRSMPGASRTLLDTNYDYTEAAVEADDVCSVDQIQGDVKGAAPGADRGADAQTSVGTAMEGILSTEGEGLGTTGELSLRTKNEEGSLLRDERDLESKEDVTDTFAVSSDYVVVSAPPDPRCDERSPRFSYKANTGAANTSGTAAVVNSVTPHDAFKSSAGGDDHCANAPIVSPLRATSTENRPVNHVTPKGAIDRLNTYDHVCDAEQAPSDNSEYRRDVDEVGDNDVVLWSPGGSQESSFAYSPSKISPSKISTREVLGMEMYMDRPPVDRRETKDSLVDTITDDLMAGLLKGIIRENRAAKLGDRAGEELCGVSAQFLANGDATYLDMNGEGDETEDFRMTHIAESGGDGHVASRTQGGATRELGGRSDVASLAAEPGHPRETSLASSYAEMAENEQAEDMYHFAPVPVVPREELWEAVTSGAAKDEDAVDPFVHAANGTPGQIGSGTQPSLGMNTLDLPQAGERQHVLPTLDEEDETEEFGQDDARANEHSQSEDHSSFIKSVVMEYPEFPWWPVLASTIETALKAMSLDELNTRMAAGLPPEEPFVEELQGEDALDYPSPAETPLDDNAVIPPRVIDMILDASDEEVMASLDMQGLGGVSLPDRDSMDAARWAAFDAANEYLSMKRAERAPRRPCDAPAPNGKFLHRLSGFGTFTSIDEAVLVVTNAVLSHDGACLPGREPNPSLVEMFPIDDRPEDWVYHEDDSHYVKCRLAEDILEDLLNDTAQECKRVFALRDADRAGWRAIHAS